MKEPTLYLMVGYPGAGKTTVSKLIAKSTDAVHLWADSERHKMFGRPTHAHQENLDLYDRLNAQAEQLLAAGKSVVFDTSFNLYEDRQKLREIATNLGAKTIVLWITTPKYVAKKRAVHAMVTRNGYTEGMNEQQFDTLASKLEPPHDDEEVVRIDGAKIDEAKVRQLFS